MQYDPKDGVPTIVTITSYSTTAVLHVQGCLHEVWVDTLLDAIEQKVKNKLQINEPQPLNQPSEHELTLSFDAAKPSSSPPTSGFNTHTEIYFMSPNL